MSAGVVLGKARRQDPKQVVGARDGRVVEQGPGTLCIFDLGDLVEENLFDADAFASYRVDELRGAEGVPNTFNPFSAAGAFAFHTEGPKSLRPGGWGPPARHHA